jgi:hypothetical protein
MDPNAAVDELRSLAAQHMDERWADLFVGLDAWLQRGGFLPRDWRPGEMKFAARKTGW